MATVVMITGGNIGEVEGNLKRAKQMVGQRVGEIIEESKVYGSEPWGRFRRAEREEGAGEAGVEERAVNAEDREVEEEKRLVCAEEVADIGVEEARGGERGKIRERGESGEKDYKVRGFLNQVLIVETKLEAIEVLDVIQQIERELGRVREKVEERVCGGRSEEKAEEKGISRIVEERECGVRGEEISMREKETERCYRSRTMDIDILYYDNIVMESQRLVIPHPMIERREFVLLPLAELMPNYKDPRTGRTVNQMLENSYK